MKKIVVLLFLLLMPFVVTALPEVNITPSFFNLSTNKNTLRHYTFNLKNYGNETAYNISFNLIPEFNFPFIQELTATTDINLTFSLQINDTGTFSYSPKFTYYYKVNETIPAGVKNLGLYSVGYVPSTLIINTGDIINATNFDLSYNHTITSFNQSLFDETILANSSKNITLSGSNIEYTIYDRVIGYTGKIQIVTGQNVYYAHSSSLDRTFNVTANVTLLQGNININIFKTNYSISANGQEEGALEITNIGSSAISNVRFSGNWIAFSPQGFNLNQNENKVITFVVTPDVKNTNETNKTYTKNINITTDNAGDFQRNISVFVRFREYGTDLTNRTIIVNRLSVDDTIDFCLLQPDDADCIKLIKFCLLYPTYKTCAELYKSKIIEVEKPLNFTQSEVQLMIDGTKYSGNVLQRIENKYNVLYDDIKELKTSYNSLAIGYMNLTETQLANNKELKRQKTWNTVWFFIKGFLVVCFISLIGGFFLFRWLAHEYFFYKRLRT